MKTNKTNINKHLYIDSKLYLKYCPNLNAAVNIYFMSSFQLALRFIVEINIINSVNYNTIYYLYV